jgi:hypothetical protein
MPATGERTPAGWRRSREKPAGDGVGGSLMAGGREERNREALRGYFEVFKHLSAISTAVLVVVLVLYRDLYLDPALALLSLVAFGLSVLASFYGMFLAMNYGLYQGPSKLPSSLRRLLYVAAGALGGAVLCLIAGIAIASMF